MNKMGIEALYRRPNTSRKQPQNPVFPYLLRALNIRIEFNIFSSPPILERTIFKALLAQDAGKDVRKLIVIADSGSGVLLKAPIPQSIINWVCKKYKISILIWELTDIDESLIRN
jgi:hypothetical protein